MSLAPGVLDSGSLWSFSSCLSSSNLSELAARPWARPWIAYSETSWAGWMAQLGFCALPGSGQFTTPLNVSRCATCKAAWCRDDFTWFFPAKNKTAIAPAGAWASSVGWVPGAWMGQGYVWFSPADMLACFAGRIIVFEGDSLTRQLFLRLVWWVRGVTHLVEHYFSQHASYTFNTTHDNLTIYGKQPMRVYSRARDISAEHELVADLSRFRGRETKSLTLVFRWAATAHTAGPIEDAPRFFRPVIDRVAAFVRGHIGQFIVSWPASQPKSSPAGVDWHREAVWFNTSHSPLATCHSPLATCHIPHRTSHIAHPTSHIPHPTSHILHPTSRFSLPTSHFPLPHPTSHFPLPTSHFPLPTSHIPPLSSHSMESMQLVARPTFIDDHDCACVTRRCQSATRR